jgi:hypothetical protein
VDVLAGPAGSYSGSKPLSGPDVVDPELQAPVPGLRPERPNVDLRNVCVCVTSLWGEYFGLGPRGAHSSRFSVPLTWMTSMINHSPAGEKPGHTGAATALSNCGVWMLLEVTFLYRDAVVWNAQLVSLVHA